MHLSLLSDANILAMNVNYSALMASGQIKNLEDLFTTLREETVKTYLEEATWPEYAITGDDVDNWGKLYVVLELEMVMPFPVFAQIINSRNKKDR